MPTRLSVPKVSANVDDVTVTKWLIPVGGKIEIDDPVVEVTTDKAAFEIESPVSGLLISVLAPARAVVPIGYILGVIGDNGETDDETVLLNKKLMDEYRSKAAGPDIPLPERRIRSHRSRRIRATPRARRLAKEYGIDLEKVSSETKAPTINEAILAPYIRDAESAE